ncbi:MAG TPA: hypothetical protein VKP88_03490 [Candidatus Paceibacterota bacterium]|nr:hypothetical protein [Candidatus Paceibacterota bacterium]
MSHTFKKTIDNDHVVQLERANQITELLTERHNTEISSDLKALVQQAALTEIIS